MRNGSFKLFFRPDGTIEGLNPDGFPLQSLGKAEINRASNVEFNEQRQEWVVTLPNGNEVFSHLVRGTALAWERKYFDAVLSGQLVCEKCGKLIPDHFSFLVCDSCEREICSQCIDGKDTCPVCGEPHTY
jgi:RNA polymerase subunit RPABC4/transcription elongation factor Spt4